MVTETEPEETEPPIVTTTTTIPFSELEYISKEIYDNWYCEIMSDHTIFIDGYDGAVSGGAVTIPAELHGMRVRAINMQMLCRLQSSYDDSVDIFAPDFTDFEALTYQLPAGIEFLYWTELDHEPYYEQIVMQQAEAEAELQRCNKTVYYYYE